jgi:hypothetical protein
MLVVLGQDRKRKEKGSPFRPAQTNWRQSAQAMVQTRRFIFLKNLAQSTNEL